jgi:hypothetical protein
VRAAVIRIKKEEIVVESCSMGHWVEVYVEWPTTQDPDDQDKPFIVGGGAEMAIKVHRNQSEDLHIILPEG